MQLARSKIDTVLAGKHDPQHTARLMAELRERIIQDAQIILYGVAEPHARQKYVDFYGCVAWHERALDKIAAFKRIVEIGAGRGEV